MGADKYISVNDVFLDIVAGLDDTVYFEWGDLKSGKIEQLNKYPKLPMIFMLIPDSISKTDKADTLAIFRGITINFLIVDKYKRIDNSSDYKKKQERLQKDVNEALGQIMFNFTYAIEKSNHIRKVSSVNFTEELPVGLQLRDNETGKREPLFHDRFTGFLLSVTCDIRKYFQCSTDIYKKTAEWDNTKAY